MSSNPLDAPIIAPKQYRPTNRLKWYFKHAAACMLLLTIVSALVLGLAPLLPKVIDDLIAYSMLVVLMFGLCGITIYTYAKGLQWNILAAIIGGATTFLVCFVYIMNEISHFNIDWYKNLAHKWFDIDPDNWLELYEFIIIGILYSLLVVVCTEVILLIALLGKTIFRLFE